MEEETFGTSSVCTRRGAYGFYLRGTKSEDRRQTVKRIVCVEDTVLQIVTALCIDTLPALNLEEEVDRAK